MCVLQGLLSFWGLTTCWLLQKEGGLVQFVATMYTQSPSVKWFHFQIRVSSPVLLILWMKTGLLPLLHVYVYFQWYSWKKPQTFFRIWKMSNVFFCFSYSVEILVFKRSVSLFNLLQTSNWTLNMLSLLLHCFLNFTDINSDTIIFMYTRILFAVKIYLWSLSYSSVWLKFIELNEVCIGNLQMGYGIIFDVLEFKVVPAKLYLEFGRKLFGFVNIYFWMEYLLLLCYWEELIIFSQLLQSHVFFSFRLFLILLMNHLGLCLWGLMVDLIFCVLLMA